MLVDENHVWHRYLEYIEINSFTYCKQRVKIAIVTTILIQVYAVIRFK